MIDLTTETPITLQRAARHRLIQPMAGKAGKVHFTTVWRWTVCGVRGVKLETVRGPKGLLTTEQAIIRFIEALSRPASVARPVTPRQRERALDRTRAALDRAGI